jgi:hypothetical protein
MLKIRGISPNSRGKPVPSKVLRMEEVSRMAMGMAMETGKEEMEMGKMEEHQPR